MPLRGYLPEWTFAMRSAERSPRTIASYTAGVRSLDANAPGAVEPADLTHRTCAAGWPS